MEFPTLTASSPAKLHNNYFAFRLSRFLSFLYLCLFIFLFLFFFTLSARIIPTSSPSALSSITNPLEETGLKQHPNGELEKISCWDCESLELPSIRGHKEGKAAPGSVWRGMGEEVVDFARNAIRWRLEELESTRESEALLFLMSLCQKLAIFGDPRMDESETRSWKNSWQLSLRDIEDGRGRAQRGGDFQGAGPTRGLAKARTVLGFCWLSAQVRGSVRCFGPIRYCKGLHLMFCL